MGYYILFLKTLLSIDGVPSVMLSSKILHVSIYFDSKTVFGKRIFHHICNFSSSCTLLSIVSRKLLKVRSYVMKYNEEHSCNYTRIQ